MVIPGLFLGKGRLGKACWHRPFFQKWQSLSRCSAGTTYQGDLCEMSLKELPTYETVIFAISPGSRTELAYEKIYIDALTAALTHLQYKRFILCSSTAIYAENEGRWINEESTLDASSFRSTILGQAEMLVRNIAWDDFVILRFSGLYQEDGSSCGRKTKLPLNRWANKISYQQGAMALEKASLHNNLICQEVFSITSDRPYREVYDPLQPCTGKRISNEKAKALLGLFL